MEFRSFLVREFDNLSSDVCLVAMDLDLDEEVADADSDDTG